MLLAQSDAVTERELDLPPAPLETATGVEAHCAFAEAKARAIAEFEQAYLCRLMAETGGNVSAASRLAGKERRAFARLLKKHGIDRRAYEVG